MLKIEVLHTDVISEMTGISVPIIEEAKAHEANDEMCSARESDFACCKLMGFSLISHFEKLISGDGVFLVLAH